MAKDKTCRERWAEHKNGRIRDIRKLWKLYLAGNDDGDPEVGTLADYGLSFDYYQPEDGAAGHFVWLLSTGGPGDELRFYASPDFRLIRAEYVFLDWFDGHARRLTGRDVALLAEIWREFFVESETARYVFEKATAR